ncbi:MAG: D-amino-acid dehydrogenase [Betaproteobacteria bacterium]|nr:MAG: D-amino-acid dehydrogenase [Betaproteobacteria bacterium]
MRVLVIGAGVIGLTTAYFLQRQGFEVTVVDRETGVGRGASGGNGAQLSYSYVAPLAEPSVLAKLPSLLFARDSPLVFRPRLEPAQWLWGMRFLAAATRERARATTAALLKLAFLSRDLIEPLIADEAITCDFKRGGKLVVYPDEASFAAARAQVEYQATLGCEQMLLSRELCVGREPALAGYADRIVGGVWTPSDAAADCAAFCEQLADRLRDRGVRFELGREVSSLRARNGRFEGADVDGGSLAADVCVLAAGSHAPRLARDAGLRLPIYPLKGYAITLPVARGAPLPGCSITDIRRKVVFAPLGARVRVAGFVEMAGHDARIPQARIDALVAAAREVIGLKADLRTELQPWCGFRPATPSGLPIIGATPVEGLYLNVGHGTLGWTLAAGSAKLLAEVVAGARSFGTLRAPPTIDPRPFAFT